MLNLNSQILWTFVNLIVLFLLLKKFLFRPISNIMEKRAQTIANDLKEAADKNAQAQALQQQYAAEIAQAQKQSAQIVKEAQEKAQREYDRILAQAHADAQRTLKDAENAVAAQREQTMQEMESHLAGIVLLAAAKVAQKNMDSASNKSYIDAFVSEVGAAK